MAKHDKCIVCGKFIYIHTDIEMSLHIRQAKEWLESYIGVSIS
jgi:hypothetical protein